MEFLKNVFFISSLVYCSIIVKAQQKDLTDYYKAHQTLNQFNGNVLVTKNNKIVFQNTINLNSVKDSFKITQQSKFIIASVSKVFIKVAILKLAEQGKLKLTDTIGKYVAGFPNGNIITIEQLMHHKSGLPREITNYENYDSITLLQAIELVKKESLLFEPNTQTAYSNVGYFLLHYIINKVTDKGYFQFMQKELFNKLKLRNTFEYNHAKNKQDFSNGFSNENEIMKAAETKTINQFETGNIITTINDLSTFSKKIVSTNFLNAKSKTILFQSDSTLIQAGGRPGYRAYFSINLKNKTTFLLLSNQSNIPFDEIIKETNNIIDNKPFKLPQNNERKEIEMPIETLNKYVGIYISSEHKLNLSIKIIDKHLVAVEPDNNQTKLFAEAENSFFDNPKSKDTYSFISNEKGEITTFQILTNGMKINLKRQN